MGYEEIIILLPLIFPLVTATISLFFKKNTSLNDIISIVGSSSLLVISAAFLFPLIIEEGIVTTQIGGWEAPFGITIVVDMFSALMLLIASIVGLMVTIYAIQNISSKKKGFGFFVFFHLLIMAVNGAFLAGDIFNLYVWFEVMLIASFVLLVLGNGKKQLIATVKYTLLSFIASAFLLIGVGMIYGITGSLNMADVALFVQENDNEPLITVAAVLFMLPFSIKAALFPLYFWLPDSYHTPDISISALFSGLLTKVGIYAMIRFFTLIFIHDINYTHTILLVVAGFTMLSGVFGALSKMDMRRILSFHIVSQVGYMILGLALYTPLAVAGAIFYVIQHILAKTNLFLITGLVEKIKGSSNLKEISGLYHRFPIVSIIFLIVALSLAGLPPFSAFWAKFILIKAGFEVKEYFVVAIALITGLLTLFSMVKIWVNAFWGKEQKERERNLIKSEKSLFKNQLNLIFPVVMIALATLFIGLFSMPLMEYASIAAEQLMNPDLYIKAVLGSSN
ncbi:cation:proton antiporter [Marivirga tractuosa]|uniref:Multisubunit sodium/proton antiporter, MrpD subunit n=1 Tax=Marivirga tractuosa (strain ATCC 23168 / DSM 4126 / NBRC 15989 / NCIMB 1408 / VKM B-1430 / H-43) TaxID=643867 RepID=E4TQ92_MARTH|nr:Na+/H+ antiporter subunit D [Marivirga tractuosa]ADR22615.1 multisubunit sodium/proton antiporter, MrpD subunit [Marivirga tractuosa DSM 4126]BDD16714.1 cation:proton antiporter [Marivirga tractuosa]